LKNSLLKRKKTGPSGPYFSDTDTVSPASLCSGEEVGKLWEREREFSVRVDSAMTALEIKVELFGASAETEGVVLQPPSAASIDGVDEVSGRFCLSALLWADDDATRLALALSLSSFLPLSDSRGSSTESAFAW
jgi:hypothetical protein